jgi:hypothetical protein
MEDGPMKATRILRLLTVSGLSIQLSFSIITTDTSAQTATRTVKPLTKRLNSQRSTNKLPDLKIENISLDRNQNIIIRIRNSGTLPIPKNEFKKCIVRVQFDRNVEDFYLGSTSKHGKPPIDPAGILLRPGGRISYNTRIRVQKTLQAGVFVDYSNTIIETDETNNKSDRVTLYQGDDQTSPTPEETP